MKQSSFHRVWCVVPPRWQAQRPSSSKEIFALTRWLVIALVLLPTAAVADEGRKMSLQGQLGTNLYEHQFSSDGMPAMDQTIADKFELIEQVSGAWWWSEKTQLGLQLQFSEDVGKSTLVDVQFQPFVGWQPIKALDLAFALVLAPRAGGRNEFGFGVQPSIGTNVKLAEHLHLVFTVQLPIIIEPEPTLQLAPLFGLSYDR